MVRGQSARHTTQPAHRLLPPLNPHAPLVAAVLVAADEDERELVGLDVLRALDQHRLLVVALRAVHLCQFGETFAKCVGGACHGQVGRCGHMK